jgi:tRNA1(Val) A37 N6-methylase TrmN6
MDIVLQEGERVDEINDRLKLIQRENGLTFGTDAYLLSCFCRPAKNTHAADLGCGTGVISLLLAARGRYQRIYAVEAQDTFAALAARNVELNGFSHTVSVLNRDVRELSPADFGGELDVIFSNPPYMRADNGFPCTHAEKQIARHEILGDLGDFTAAAARCLRYGGSFYLVYRPDRLETMFAALKKSKLAPKRVLFVQDAPEKAPSMVLCEARLGGGEGLVMLPTLILRESAQNGAPLTPRAQRVYDTGSIE